MSKSKPSEIPRTEFIPIDERDNGNGGTTPIYGFNSPEPNSRTGSIVGVSDITENKLLWRQLVSEFLGTFLLTSIGVASCIALDDGHIGIGYVGIALTFGLLVASIVQAIAHVSGGHINPAVTFGLLVSGDIKLLKAIAYIIAQVLGAVAGAGLIRVSIPSDKIGGFGLTLPSHGVTAEQAFLIEILITFILVFVVKGVCDGQRIDVKGSGPLAIGLSIAACHCACIQFSGSSMNPARSFGPAAIEGNWTSHWVYWAGPLLGGALAGLTYRFVLKIGKPGESGSYDF